MPEPPAYPPENAALTLPNLAVLVAPAASDRFARPLRAGETRRLLSQKCVEVQNGKGTYGALQGSMTSSSQSEKSEPLRVASFAP